MGGGPMRGRSVRLSVRRQPSKHNVPQIIGFIGEHHLGRHSVTAAGHHPVQMGWTPAAIGRVSGIGPRFDREKTEAAIAICRQAGETLESVVQGRCAQFGGMSVPAKGVGLPQVQFGSGGRLAARVQHTARDLDDLSFRTATAAAHPRKIGVLVARMGDRIEWARRALRSWAEEFIGVSGSCKSCDADTRGDHQTTSASHGLHGEILPSSLFAPLCAFSAVPP